MSQPLGWPGMLRAGVQGLGLVPEVFWRLSPAELRLMLGEGVQLAPLTRTRLEELARAFPDETQRKDER
jgi:uncharacterized phage protein (TIGR02216 family)